MSPLELCLSISAVIMNENRIHKIFEVGVVLKGLHALAECLGGIVLYLVDTAPVVTWVNRLTLSELAEDPHDPLATFIDSVSGGFTAGAQSFYAFYLLSHGLVKLALVVGLLRNQLWAYPATLASMVFFIVYQIYRYSYTQSVGLLILTALDLVVIVLVWHEWRILRRHRIA